MNYPWEQAMVLIRRSIWLRRRRLAMCHFKTSERILDLGCGDGLDISILKDLGCQNIVGVDISQNLINQAEKLNPWVRFIKAKAQKLPFRDKSFDAVLADSMIYHLAGDERAFKEINRVLVKGGKLCIFEAHNSRLRKLYDWLTFSPISHIFPYLTKRRKAYLAEKEAILRWQKAEPVFYRNLERYGFRKKFLRTDFLTVIALFQKT